jgi:hypothetical protein
VKIGFTGSRMGMNEQQKDLLLSELHRLGATELHHGDCVGADAQAHEVARKLGLHIVGHPPKASGLRAFCDCDEVREPAGFITRDHNIVLETQILIAAPDGPERVRSGTWTTVRYSRRLQRPNVIIMPGGGLHISDS